MSCFIMVGAKGNDCQPREKFHAVVERALLNLFRSQANARCSSLAKEPFALKYSEQSKN